MPSRPITLRTLSLSLALCGVLLASVPASSYATEAPVVPPSSGSPAPSSPMPAALAELVQKMSELRPSTARLALTLDLKAQDPNAPGKTISVLMSGLLAEVGVEPPTAAVTTSSGAGSGEKVRLVHGHVYIYLPFLDRFDGRRPWVEMSEARYERDDAAGVGVAFARQTNARVDPFASVIAEIDDSHDFRELGPSDVHGQAVTGFAMTPLPSTPPTPGQSGLTAKQEAELQAAARRLGKSTSTIEVFIAADGLPVRTRITVTLGPIATVASEEVTATDFPLIVAPPPARQTIGFRALREIETKLTPK
jgi:hypothetical protein